MGKRRGNGEGSIYQRADGRWCAVLDLGYVNGKRRRRTIYAKTRKECSDLLKKLQRDQLNGLPVVTERQTVEQFLNRWLDDVVAQRNKPRTQESYRQMVRLHIVPHIGSSLLSKLSSQHCQSWLNTLHAKGLSARTVSYARAILRRALNQALRWELVTRNVAIHVEPPRAEKYVVDPLTVVQAKQLLQAIEGRRYALIYRLALLMGLRRGEVLGLQWRDIAMEQETLTITGALQRIGGKLTRTTPKTTASGRKLHIPKALLDALKAHRAEQQEEWPEVTYVFVSVVGTPIEPMNVVHDFKKVLAAAGLPTTIRFHDLRHACATFHMAAGTPLNVVKELLGHTQLATTADVYSHLLAETHRDVADRLSALLEGNGKASDKREVEEGVEG
jgi:integrase